MVLITREYQIIETLLRINVIRSKKYHLVSTITKSFTKKNKNNGNLKFVIRIRLTSIFILDLATIPVIESESEYTPISSRNQNITKFETL